MSQSVHFAVPRLRGMLIFSLILLVSIFAALPLAAQSDRGTVTGAISDPAGAVVPNAPVEFKNQETGAVYQVASTATGNFTQTGLPAGNYEMSVSVAGFKKYVRTGIAVQVAQTLRLDVALEVGAATESVTVTEAVTLLKTESGELSHTVTAQRLNELPILGIGGASATSQGLRFYLAQAQLAPGAYFAPGGLNIRVNGAPTNTQRTQIEGMDATNALINFSQASTQPSVDAIQETAIQTSNFAAEFGQVGGGMVNVTMRSGTNSFHGGAFLYNANEAYNASTPFVNIKPRTRRNNYGFNVGGPVYIPKVYDGHDKTFFFYNREQYREFFVVNDKPITVPTDAYRAGNFASVIPLNARTVTGADPIGRAILEGTIFDPLSTKTAADGRVYRDPFPGNIIPGSRIDRVAAAIQNLIPRAGTTGLANNLTPVFPNDRVTTNESVKLDHQLGSKSKLSGYWGTNATRAQFSQQLNGSEGLPDALTVTRGTFTRSYTWRVNYDYTATPTLLLHVGAGFVQYFFNDNSPTLTFDQVKTLGLNGATVPDSRFPVIAGLCQTGTSPQCTGVGGMANMGPVNGQSNQQQVTPTFNASGTKVQGNHTYKFGAEFRPFGFLGSFNTATYGTYNFSAATTGQPYTLNTAPGGINIGFPYASFLLGQVDNGIINFPANVRTGKQQWGFYAQDSWKITRRLTLDYGLRYDYSTYPREQYGRMPSLNATLPNPTVGNFPGATVFEATCNCRFGKNYKNAWGPRLGLAYQINPKTVLRLGFGIAYDGTGAAGAGNAASNNPFTAPAFGIPTMTLQDGIPDTYKTAWPNLSPGVFPNPRNPTALAAPPVVVDQNAGRPPRQIQWSIGVQREIMRNLVVEGAYVGNRGAWWQSSTLVNYNAIPDSTFTAAGLDLNSSADRAILAAQIGSTAAGRFQNRVPYAGFPTSATVAQSLRPFPQFNGGLTPLWSPTGRTWYDSLQAKVTKRLSHGLDFSYAFTYQKELNSGIDAATTNDVFNRQNNKYLSSFSRPLVSVIAANYKVPGVHVGGRIGSYALRDWTLGTVLQYASGFPIPAPLSNNNLNALRFQTTTVNRVPGVDPFLKDLNCHCVDPNADLVLNKAAWVEAPVGQYGTAARFYNDYRFQRRPQESLNFGRVFAIRERMSFMVRMELSNFFNRTLLGNPVNTNIAAATTTNAATGALSNGFGYINPVSNASAGLPRQGTLVARFTF